MTSNNGESAGEQEMREASWPLCCWPGISNCSTRSTKTQTNAVLTSRRRFRRPGIECRVAGLESCLRALEEVRRGAIEQPNAAATHAQRPPT